MLLGLCERSGHTPIVFRIVILITILQGIAFAQASNSFTLCTLSNGTATGFFGGVNISGKFTQGATPDTSSITVSGAYFGGMYSYNFTGPLNGPGYTQVSEIPPPVCVLAGCTPGETEPPGAATFHLYTADSLTASLGFEDTGELFSGYGTLSCQTITPTTPPPPPMTCPADPAYSQLHWTGTCPSGGPASVTDAGYVRGQKLNVNWGPPFPVSSSLTSTNGDTLELWCGARPGNTTFQYLLFYTPVAASTRLVGLCVWDNGCNSAYFGYAGIGQGQNGLAPQCYTSTTWISRDYGANEYAGSPNPFTHQIENPPLLDWYVVNFNAGTLEVSKTDYQYQYNYGPPVPLCNADISKLGPREKGQPVNAVRTDPQIGPALDAYFDSLINQLASLPPGVAVPSTASLADINGDGKIDMADFLAFQKAFGSCAGQPNYNIAADLDFDGCVTLRDYQIWFQFQ